MKQLLNKFLISFLAVGALFLMTFFFCSDANAAPKKKAKGGLTQEQLDTINKDLNTLTRKIYSNSLFSPKENETLINIKLDLDSAMLKAVMPEYAPLYHMEANLLKKRGYKTEAIECYETILENFADTAFAPKAKHELTKMGITIAEPVKEELEEE